jgi:hypothetical protein
MTETDSRSAPLSRPADALPVVTVTGGHDTRVSLATLISSVNPHN